MDTSIWDQILSRIETKVNRHSFSTWFKPTAFVADGGRSITVRVPNTLFKDWLTKHYSVVLSEALVEVRRAETALVFVAEPGAALQPAPEDPIPAAEDVEQVAPEWSATRRPRTRATASTRLSSDHPTSSRMRPAARSRRRPRARITRCSFMAAWVSARRT